MYTPKFTVTNITVPAEGADALSIFEHDTFEAARDAWHSTCASDHAYAAQGAIKHYVCYVSDTNGNRPGDLCEVWSEEEPEPNEEG